MQHYLYPSYVYENLIMHKLGFCILEFFLATYITDFWSVLLTWSAHQFQMLGWNFLAACLYLRENIGTDQIESYKYTASEKLWSKLYFLWIIWLIILDICILKCSCSHEFSKLSVHREMQVCGFNNMLL